MRKNKKSLSNLVTINHSEAKPSHPNVINTPERRERIAASIINPKGVATANHHFCIQCLMDVQAQAHTHEDTAPKKGKLHDAMHRLSDSYQTPRVKLWVYVWIGARGLCASAEMLLNISFYRCCCCDKRRICFAAVKKKRSRYVSKSKQNSQ